ncbi:cell division protein FtsA [Prevotella lacticifex]|uniref:Cell division protein FtsA n=1 Tax=Prevotella lacticifex TaxID=2854755 RepID=A0A9R1CZQ7_9BACT|nr:cell division protein FtsA [Prevotella lacticifex]GJG34894.1 cell division protein FtsA [Prevotella lacticifex]GJG40056.1 cell division protein FtsA [Prevotella lacticifex]GJG41263.1 cell division protein FtsA [Prevotella lacticifex]GJG46409.1 cell division protein FtsA [Prevotella lacticifex]GJG47616.1 cell division protein FtsA [Prevotella lacticifex]
MANEFIVAIELGSSKIRGIAGRKNLDGSINILAVVTEDSTQCIRKGVVYNIAKTGQCITNIINKLKAQLKREITQVYVGVGGQSIRSVRNVIVKDYPEETMITSEIINELMDANRSMSYPEQEILDAVVQEYKVDKQYQIDPVGIKALRLEGNFLNILWRKQFYDDLNTCFVKAGIAIAEFDLAPIALADSVLTDAEKRGGCVLVDLGADTTTVSVYYKNILRHLAVIPLGGNNITRDIASLQMEESDAEKMKLQYGSAYTDNSDIDGSLSYPIDGDRNVESRKFIEIVEARLDEIIENVWYQVPSDYSDKLLGGIVLTGGGSNMPNIKEAFRNHTHVEKIRIAKFVTPTITSNNKLINVHDGSMNTVLGLLVKGDMNCGGGTLNSTGDLFGNGQGGHEPADDPLRPQRPVTDKAGVVPTPADKQRKEEEMRRKHEEDLRIQREKEEEEARKIEEERKKNNPLRKLGRSFKDFWIKITEPEE